MIVGGFYVLRSAREADIRVCVLKTPPEVRRAARVRVRFESGVKAGTEADLPSRRVDVPWEERELPRQPRRTRPRTRVRAPEAVPADDPNLFPVCTEVTLPEETEGLIWEIVAIHDSDESRPTATIASRIFGQPQERTVALHALRARQTPYPRTSGDLDFGYEEELGDESPHAIGHASRSAVDLAPEKPVRQLDAVLKNLLFSPACLAFYHRRFAADTPWQGRNETLREEIRRKGFLETEAPAGAYGRIRIQGRFDVVMNREPRDIEPCLITHLVLPRSKRQARRRRHSGGDKRAA